MIRRRDRIPLLLKAVAGCSYEDRIKVMLLSPMPEDLDETY
jgi:hypothetical protein